MNIPVYFNTKAKLHTVAVLSVLFLLPVFGFAAGYFLNGNDLSYGVLIGLFGFGIMAATLGMLRKMFAKYFRARPAFILKDDAIETSSGNLVSWNWFDHAVIFTIENIRMLGLHRKSDVKKATIGDSVADFDGTMFGYPFAIQFDQFSTGEHELVKLFQTKLPIVIKSKKLNIGDEVDWEMLDS